MLKYRGGGVVVAVVVSEQEDRYVTAFSHTHQLNVNQTRVPSLTRINTQTAQYPQTSPHQISCASVTTAECVGSELLNGNKSSARTRTMEKPTWMGRGRRMFAVLMVCGEEAVKL